MLERLKWVSAPIWYSLDANPLENISNTQQIAGVMIQSRWLSRAEIKTGMDEVLAYFDSFK